MQEAYINICGVPTHVMTWGKWIEESLEDVKEIVICITGNPGLPGFYTRFMSTIHANLDPNIPIWILGHVGHDDPPSTSIRKVLQLKGNENLFDLNGQIKHKIEFIKTYVPKNTKIHLIGHSIGAWMILQMLKYPEIKNKIKKCYLLFPTIERMKESPNGKLFTHLVVPFLFILKWLLIFLSVLPVYLRVLILYAYFWVFSIPTIYIGTALKYMEVNVMERVAFLAKDEMETVTDLDFKIIQDNKDLLKFYYGTTDGWVPISYVNEIKEKIPGIDVIIDNKNTFHAFVLRSSEIIGQIVADWIKTNSA